MAEHTSTHYTCDVCGTNLGEKQTISKGKVMAHFEGEWAMDAVFAWEDMCRDCRDGAIEALSSFRASRRSALSSSQSTSREGER